MLALTRTPGTGIRIGPDLCVYVENITPKEAQLLFLVPDNNGRFSSVRQIMREHDTFNLGDTNIKITNIKSDTRVRMAIEAPSGVEIFRMELLAGADDLEDPAMGLIYNIQQLAFSMPRHDVTTDVAVLFGHACRQHYVSRIEDCMKQLQGRASAQDLATIREDLADGEFLDPSGIARGIYKQIHGIFPEEQRAPD